MESRPLLALTLDSLSGNSYSGMTGNRQTWDFLVCVAAGTSIETSEGGKLVKDLLEGDLVVTKDHGAKPVRWIVRRTVEATEAFAPVLIRAGSLGRNLPKRDLLVSQQHRILLNSKIAERITSSREVLVAAKKLTEMDSIEIVASVGELTNFHLLLDAHEVIFLEGAATEALLVGPMALASFNVETLKEIRALFPGIGVKARVPARKIVSGKPLKALLARHRKNARGMVTAG